MANRTPAYAYDTLLKHLRQGQLTWVVEQIQDQVRSGKPVVKAVGHQTAVQSIRFLEEEIDTTPSAPGRRQRLAATEPYTDEERLRIAIDAVLSAVSQTKLMREEIVEYFRLAADQTPEILFLPDEFDEATTLIIDSPTEDRKVSVAKLEELLKKLRSEVDFGD